MENREALLVLNAIENLEPRFLVRLLSHFGGAADVLSGDGRILEGMVGKSLAQKISGWRKYFDLGKEMRECKRRQIAWIDWNDSAYPDCLRHIPQPPPVLYYQGRFDKTDPYAMAIVGARRSSRYGVGVARSLAHDLARFGFTVVSGLARGIDTAAHEGALQANGRTIAILGSGFADPYPRENLALMRRIAENGLVLSEFPLARPPLARNFPRRNRIISGLSLGIVVVEAAQRSGSLITTSHALEQGKSVFAVPGRLDSESSQGTNALIKQGAKLVASIQDIVEDLQYILPASFLRGENAAKGRVSLDSCARPACLPAPKMPALCEAEKKIFDALEAEPSGIEDIIRITKLPASEVAGSLLALEMQGLVEQYPGKQFSRARGAKV